MLEVNIPGQIKDELKDTPKESLSVKPVAVPNKISETAASYDNVLIVNSDRRKSKMNIKLRKRVHRGFSPNEYFKVLNPKDSNDLALLFEDLDFIIGAPVEKAYRKYKQNKGDGFPFF